MNCQNHPETPAIAYCRECGKPLCAECRRSAQGTVYCDEHVPVTAGPAGSAETWGSGTASVNTPPAAAAPPFAPSPVASRTTASDASPALAFLAGLIPGVGAIYNGQYAKGIIHAAIFGLIISIMNARNGSALMPLFGLLIAAFYFYMPLEAYHTARRRREGQQVDELSSLIELNGSTRFPMGAVILIGLGVILLLDTTELISLDRLIRYWPVLLILLGVYLLYGRMERRHVVPVAREFGDAPR